MNKNIKSRSWTVVLTFVFITLIFALTSSAQTKPFPPMENGDTAINPHDFIDKYYVNKGVNPAAIVDRRTGSDGLSVFGWSSNPNHTAVRVIATIPAFDQYGEPHFWYPLGTLNYDGFTDDKTGYLTRETAKLFPIYVFPDVTKVGFNPFVNTRQAPIIDNSWLNNGGRKVNPLGIRALFMVSYTDKVNTPEGQEMMEYLTKKNGVATDGTPVVKSLEDMNLLTKYECIKIEAPLAGGLIPTRGQFAISPVIEEPIKGTIARDAFLLFSTRDGKPLAAEMIFYTQFNCLQKTGHLCAADGE